MIGRPEAGICKPSLEARIVAELLEQLDVVSHQRHHCAGQRLVVLKLCIGLVGIGDGVLVALS